MAFSVSVPVPVLVKPPLPLPSIEGHACRVIHLDGAASELRTTDLNDEMAEDLREGERIAAAEIQRPLEPSADCQPLKPCLHSSSSLHSYWRIFAEPACPLRFVRVNATKLRQ